MATQLEMAREGKITDEMKLVAQEERIEAETVRQRVAAGTVVICANVNHRPLRPRGVGDGLSVKVNANIGTSDSYPDIDPELKKLKAAVAAGADAVMDLSTGSRLDESRRAIIGRSPVMVGTVPMYEATVLAQREHGAVVNMTAGDILAAVEKQAKDGADFMTIHCGVTREALNRLTREGRRMDIVSRGGSFVAGWMIYNEQENPFYQHYDEILDICRKYDVTMSLGDSLRPGCIDDASDSAQLTELITLGELTVRARRAGVQVMVEGPGHMPFDQIAANMKLQKRLCHNAPFYVLGPLVTDVAPGYDHITAAIGGTMAAVAGADFLCYVTPAEHLSLPTEEDVHTGVIAARIAAHAADVARGLPSAIAWDNRMADARRRLDWEAQFAEAIDPARARKVRAFRNKGDEEGCSMCGSLCAVKIVDEYFRPKAGKRPFDD